jgi:hypothetical protein
MRSRVSNETAAGGRPGPRVVLTSTHSIVRPLYKGNAMTPRSGRTRCPDTAWAMVLNQRDAHPETTTPTTALRLHRSSAHSTSGRGVTASAQPSERLETAQQLVGLLACHTLAKCDRVLPGRDMSLRLAGRPTAVGRDAVPAHGDPYRRWDSRREACRRAPVISPLVLATIVISGRRAPVYRRSELRTRTGGTW